MGRISPIVLQLIVILSVLLFCIYKKNNVEIHKSMEENMKMCYSMISIILQLFNYFVGGACE